MAQHGPVLDLRLGTAELDQVHSASVQSVADAAFITSVIHALIILGEIEKSAAVVSLWCALLCHLKAVAFNIALCLRKGACQWCRRHKLLLQYKLGACSMLRCCPHADQARGGIMATTIIK